MADVQIDKLTIEIEANSGAATTNIKKLGKAIESLSSTGSLKTVIDSLEKLNEKLSNMSNLSSAVSGINKVSDAMKKATGVSNNMTAQTEALGSSLKNLFSQAVVIAIIQKANALLESAITNYSKYVEDANLFAVAMGNAADSGGRFAQKMENLLGIDSGESRRNMAVFQNLTTSFGMTSDKAYILSQNLTQLGYDMASFFNLSTEDSFQKLQAAISGELEPIRRLGVDISNARLQQELYNLGINKSINSLSQADKAQLRYIAIMKQTTNAQTDMGRTLNSPANQMRILKAQIDLLGRSLGAVLIPAINAILPPLIAFIQVVRMAISAIASLFGHTIQWGDFQSSGVSAAQGVSSGLDDVGGSASSAAKAVHDLIGGFDELNKAPDQSSGGGGGSGGGGSGLGDIGLPSYDMFANLANGKVTKWVEKLQKAFENIKKVLEPFMPLIKGIGAAILTAFAVGAVSKFLKKFKDFITKAAAGSAAFEALKKAAGVFVSSLEYGAGFLRSFSLGLQSFRSALPVWAKVATAVAVAVGTFVTAYDAMKKFGQGAMDLKTAATNCVAAFALFGTIGGIVLGPVGVVIAAVGTAAGAFLGYRSAMQEAGQEMANESQFCQTLNYMIDQSTASIQRATDNQQELNEKIQSFSDVGTKYAGVQTLVDSIFDLSEKSNKSAFEVQQLQSQVEYLNGMGLEGLKLHMDETGTKALETRDDVNALIESLEKAAYAAAAQNLLESAYKAQIQAEQDLAAANDRLAASKEVVDTATTALSNYRNGLSTWGEMLADLGLDAQYNALSDSLSKANEAYETATSDVQAQQEALTNANSAIDTYTQKLVDIKSGNFDMADSVISSTNQVDTSMAQVRDSANQTAGTVTSANSNITTSATNSAATISSSYSAAAQSVQGSTGQMSSAAENAKERMTQSANNTASTYAASFDNINSGARRNAETVKDSASNAASGVEDAATRSGNALSGLPEKAKQWGSDFASSFVDSFVDTWTVLKSGFEDAAKWISERFHFSVPDKGPLADADTWMPDMMKLFASGIERNKNSVIRQVAGLSASIQKELTDAPVNVSAEGTVVSKHNVEVSGKQFSSAQAYRTGNGSADVVAAIRALGTIMERNSDTKVVINGREVFRAVKDEAHREQIRTGSPAF